MQEKKNIRLLVSLAVLLVITGAVYFFSREDGSHKIDKQLFRINDLKAVDKIIFTAKNRAVELKYTGSQWMVDDKYIADRNLVDVLFATLQQVEPKRPVATLIKDSVSRALFEEGVKVSLFSQEKKVQTFYAGGNIQKTQAYFKNDSDDDPYIMVIPGYRVYASGVFELDENGWRDKRIFTLNWRNFKNLSASVPNDSKQDFKISFIDKYFRIENLQTDTTKLNDYLDAISYLTAYQFIKKDFSPRYDSLSLTQPALKIEIKDVADRTYSLEVFFPLKNDPYVLGSLGNDEFVLFQRQTVMPLVKGRNYFEQKTRR